MLHSLICLVDSRTPLDATDVLGTMLAPFAAEGWEAHVHLSAEELQSVATHYQAGDNPYLDPERTLPYGDSWDGLSAATIRFKRQGVLHPIFLIATAKCLHDWYGHPGGIDQHGVYYRTRENPDGRWSNWEVGGKDDGALYGSSVVVTLWDSESTSHNDSRWVRNRRPAAEVTYIPDALLTPEPVWHEPYLCLDGEQRHESHGNHHWEAHCHSLYQRYAQHHAVLLGFTP